MSDHGSVRELLPLFALGALEGSAECDLVCSHLASGCAACAEELASLSRTAAALPAALPPLAPRPGARERLEAKLKTVSQSAPPEIPSNLATLPRPRERGIPRWAFSAAAGLAAVGLVFGGATYQELLQERDARWSAEKLASEQMDDLEHMREEQAVAREMLAKLADPQVRMFDIAAVGQETGAGRILWDKKGRTWSLYAKDLKPLPPDKVYELWFIAGNRKIPAGRFRPDVYGIVRHSIALPPGLDAIDVGAITREPVDDADPQNPSNELVAAGKSA